MDVELRAYMPDSNPMKMPPREAWCAWAEEVTDRLENIEPLMPDEMVHETDDGRLEIRAWKGEPRAHVQCSPHGELLLESVVLSGFEILRLPRVLDDPQREDGYPHLAPSFERARRAIQAWAESLDHLRPES